MSRQILTVGHVVEMLSRLPQDVEVWQLRYTGSSPLFVEGDPLKMETIDDWLDVYRHQGTTRLLIDDREAHHPEYEGRREPLPRAVPSPETL